MSTVTIKDKGKLVIPGEGTFKQEDLTPEVYARLKETYPKLFQKLINRKQIIESNGDQESIS